MNGDGVVGTDFVLADAESQAFSFKPGDKMRLDNQTGAKALIVVHAKASGMEVQIDLPQDGMVQITVGTENVDVTLKGDEAGALRPTMVH